MEKTKINDKFHKVVITSSKTKALIINFINLDHLSSNMPEMLESKVINGVVDPNVAGIQNTGEWEMHYPINETKNLISICLKTKSLKYGWNYEKNRKEWLPCAYMKGHPFMDVKLSKETNQSLTDTLLDLYLPNHQGQKTVMSENGLI